jgi:RNA polymerase sigma-70 factor (ECF subfamily)
VVRRADHLAGFAAIFDAYFPEVHRYIARRLGPDAADDLAAETFTTAFRRRDSYDCALGEVRPWLFGIASNLIARHRRLEARTLRALERLEADPSRGVHDDRLADWLNADAVRPALARALAGLSPRLRDVLLLVVLGELTYGEVGRALDIPYGTVCSRYKRARDQVRRALDGTSLMLDAEEFHG